MFSDSERHHLHNQGVENVDLLEQQVSRQANEHTFSQRNTKNPQNTIVQWEHDLPNTEHCFDDDCSLNGHLGV